MSEIKETLNDDSLLNRKEAAAFCKCSEREISRYVDRGLKKIVFGPRNVRYRLRDLKKFIARHLKTAMA
ncbi:helix-turn-helix domain-containing protein [Ruficoccus sp. ZRK36]|uniref:helix-turn-helix transcriptional regulator n=1 Tax=Ruficoccus sp. ZRK36 TaxID=2866311 RepID=UPI001C72C95F|nr:helix-turn-helix domain-containing protein [Ruficoccus sp. ZRK36]QYY35258.1 helix-turn-helix domain-containing protein [Ruficoccus sp. ZRK36]